MFKTYWNKMVTNVQTPSFDMSLLPANVIRIYKRIESMEHGASKEEQIRALIKKVEHIQVGQRSNPTLKERAINTQKFLDVLKIKLK